MSSTQDITVNQAADTRNAASESMLAHARQSVAGGANSTMRVLPYHLPLAIERADGARIRDVDGNELIDMNMGYGPLIFGHRAPLILDAIREELDQRGTVLGFPHELSHQVAELIKKSVPSVDSLRFCSTGTEAGNTAIRLARAFTGRKKIVLFEGHYHGSADATFHKYHAPVHELDGRDPAHVMAGSGGMADAPHHALLAPWNDIDALRAVIAENGDDIAAVIMEPVMGNGGVIPPQGEYLKQVRDEVDRVGGLLIFDEVITGFRVARGGAQERFGVAADITTFSKAMAGGVPLAAVGGRSDIMAQLEDGRVFHGGVYSGNPMCLAAALATQREFDKRGHEIYAHLEAVTTKLAQGLRALFQEAGVRAHVQHVGAMLSCWPLVDDAPGTFTHYRDVAQFVDAERFIALQHRAQHAGVYFHPNRFEPWFISTAHTDSVIDEVLDRLAPAIHETH